MIESPSQKVYNEGAAVGKRLCVGLDLDGVLADWMFSITDIGRKLFQKPAEPVSAATASDWDLMKAAEIGYTQEEVRRVLAEARITFNFLVGVPFLLGEAKLFPLLQALPRVAECHIITARRFPYNGYSVAWQTREWLSNHGLHGYGLVFTPDKKAAADLLGLDMYLDDHPLNSLLVNDVISGQSFVCAREYNKSTLLPRVSVAQFLEIALDRALSHKGGSSC